MSAILSKEPITFTVYSKPEPQGSSKAFVVAGRARITSANAKLKPFRGDVTREAMHAMADLDLEPFGKYVPLKVSIAFYFNRPPSIPRVREQMVVRPDLDKLVRSVSDSMTGVVFHDDSQVVAYEISKHYGSPAKSRSLNK